MGRPRKSIEELIANGTYRRDRHGSLQERDPRFANLYAEAPKSDRPCEICGGEVLKLTEVLFGPVEHCCGHRCRMTSLRRKLRIAQSPLRKCKGCDSVFRPTHGAAMHCTRKCASKTWGVEKRCPICAKMFLSRNTETCSKVCGAKLQHEKSPRVEKACRTCHAMFVALASKSSQQKYCSMYCNEKARRKTRNLYLSVAARIRALRIEVNGFEKIDPIAVFERDGWVCWICEHAVNKAVEHPHCESATIDHVVPISKGGPHTYANVRCAHFVCNSSKNNRTLAEAG